ncbi:MAG: LysM peptidoglycan-binding domain-containing protein [Opitutae bacterium]|nr:LysM peptidoglycan-binding domain-containing protein [Opitutae bacterium]
MPRTTFPLRRWLLLLCGAAAMWLAGCGDNDRFSYATETDEPAYREGQSLLKTGRRQEALSSFLKVIEKRGDDAPESHLEVGLLYLQHINDPVSAIYHFKKYLSLRPNSPQAPLVKQRIDAALREFARTLPAQPLDSQLQRVDLIATLDKLKVENELLKQQIADLQAGKGVDVSAIGAPAGSGSTVSSTQAPADNKIAFNLDSIPTVRTRPQRAEPPPTPAPVTTSRRPAPPPPTRTGAATSPAQPVPARNATRKHTVQKGDTLSNLAQRYYGNRAKWRDIFAANRGVMKNEGDLRVGMELTIP